MLRTHCGGHKCFPVCPRGQHLLRTQNLCPRHKNVSDFFQKHFVSATNVSPFARPRKHHEQQCVRHNVSSFATTLKNITRNFSAIGGKTCLRAEERSWKDGNTGVGTNECRGNQFVPINGGEKK